MLRAAVSTRLGRLPRPGPPPRTWVWEDVLERAAPPDDARVFASFTLRHGSEEDRDPGVRLAYGTIVSTHASGADIIVNELIAVEPRVLTDVLRVEDRVTRQVAKGSLAGLRIVRYGSSAVASRVGVRPAAHPRPPHITARSSASVAAPANSGR